MLPLILAAIGLLCFQNVSISQFWGFTALITFILTLGSATPLSWIIFHIPVFNKFRVPSRHFIEMTFAFSVLSGLGVASIQKKLLSNDLLKKIYLFSTGLIIIVCIAILSSRDQIINRIKEVGGQEEASNFALIPWHNPAIGIPLLMVVLSLILLMYWSQSPSSRFLKLFIILFLIFDLGSFGWFCEWQYNSPNKSLLTPTTSARKYAKILNASQQRMLSIRGGLGKSEEIPVNMSRLWGVPNASGYGPLILSRMSQLLSMGTPGDVSSDWRSKANRSLDIMSIRYVFYSQKLIICI